MCWVVGLILFVSLGILLLFDVIIMIVFFRCGIFVVTHRPVLLILVVACVGCNCKKWTPFWSSMWDHWDDLGALYLIMIVRSIVE